MADDTFPEVLVEKSEIPLYMNIITSFLVFWFFALLPFLFICFLLFSHSPSRGGRYSDGYSNYSGGGYDSGGYSGGGGDFGGGGASR